MTAARGDTAVVTAVEAGGEAATAAVTAVEAAPAEEAGEAATAAEVGGGGRCYNPVVRRRRIGPIYPTSTGKEERMALYILLSTLSDEGRKTVKSKPERIKEVNKEIEGMGAKILGQYAVLGMYDFVNVVEAPGNETMVKISVALGARGTVQIMTLPAMPIDDFIKSLKK
jgi:uncharacterized protein with GYD domain